MAIKMTLPKIGVNMTEAVIAEWLVAPGDVIKEGDPILNAETDKATQDIYATAGGTIGKLTVNVGDTVQTQETILLLLEDGETVESLAAMDTKEEASEEKAEETAPVAEAPAAAPVVAPVASSGKVRISPLAKRMCKDNGIDPSLVSPAIAGKRIVKDDVLAHMAKPVEAPAPVAPVAQAPLASTALGTKVVLPEGQEIVEVIAVKGVRKVIAERMTESNLEKPVAALTASICVDKLKEVSKNFKAMDIKVGFNEMLIRIVARALSEHRQMNSVMSEGEIWLLKDVNVGVAVDTERGLMVPVIKNADHKSMMEISNDFRGKIAAIRDNAISPDELCGGTFTITNLGTFGIEHFVPVINPPEAGILGVGNINPVFVPDENGNPVIKNMMKVTLVFDHRIIDGAPAARFLQRIREYAENPQMLL